MDKATRQKLLPFALTAAILISDQLTKTWVLAHVPPGTIAFSFWGDFFWLIRQQNLGMAFSLLDGDGGLDPAGEAEGDAVVQAEGLELLHAEHAGQDGVVADLGMLVQGQMAGVEGDIGVEEELHALAQGSRDARRLAPE